MKIKLLNRAGIFLMAAVILLALPLTVPRLFGYKIYSIVSESMEPEFSKGTAVYVKPVDFKDIKTGDIITYKLGTDTELPATHRVAETDEEKRRFLTKGDANASNDRYPVGFDQVIGKVIFHIPFLGIISGSLQTPLGLGICIGTFLLTLLLWEISSRLKGKESKSG